MCLLTLLLFHSITLNCFSWTRSNHLSVDLGQITELIIFKIVAHSVGIMNSRMLTPEFLSRYPISITCHNCQEKVVTVTRSVMGNTQQMIGVIMGFSIVLLPFCWIPCVIPAWNDVLHHCPNCQVCIGIYRPRICCWCIA